MYWGLGVDVFYSKDPVVSINRGGVHGILSHVAENAFCSGGHTWFASVA
jgi:hypothetical protein